MQIQRFHPARLAVAAAVALLVSACSKEAPSPAPEQNTAAADLGANAPLETRPPHGKDYQPAFPGQTRAPGLKSDIALDVTEVATGLNYPWAFEFLPDERVLLTERPGALRILDKDGKLSPPVKGVPAVLYETQGGLLDVALDPEFEANRTIYLSYSDPRKDGSGTNLAKAVLVENEQGASLDKVEVIFRQMPTLDSGPKLHFGSRIVFAPDGKIFLALGERGVPEGREQSQHLNSHFGKVVRINRDGSVPEDNPFVGRSDAKPEIWSYGHRNIQAAALDGQGRLWTVEHGPLGGDELNLPQPGKNYGWPVIGYGIDYSGQKMGDGITQHEGMEQPVYYWDPVIAPSGLLFYSGSMFPEWQGSAFIGGLSGAKLVRLEFENDRVSGEEWLLTDRAPRVRDVKQAADGALYVLTDGADAKLLRVARQ